jgi:hypothetical protein
MVELQKISDHGRTSMGSSAANGGKINVKHLGHSQWVLTWGKGSKRQSRTMHCSEADAKAQKKALDG